MVQRTKLFAGTVKYLWPFQIVFSILRGVVMTLELLRGYAIPHCSRYFLLA